ncbi:MAG: ribosome silencing factor [Candidatus Melainabacteria bacterium]|nr:MAG: ribosome silencing factor [Candidatus Melainabacteria bacterium]
MERNITSLKLASVVARVLDDNLAKDIVILDISNISVLGDYFVIASADNQNQVRALTNYVRENIKKNLNVNVSKDESDKKNRWNLLDYGDVIVHILHNEERELYALEKFWNHALKIEREVWLENSKEFAKFDNN